MLQASMDLPPDKAKVLRSYDNDKKWDLICDQERVQAKEPPHTYLQKLQGYMEVNTAKKKSSRKMMESTQVLRDIEISLRTNNIEWVKEFLNQENSGLDVLVDYLTFSQIQIVSKDDTFGSMSANSSLRNMVGSSPYAKSPSRKSTKKNRDVGTTREREDVHVCIMCLRAIMNYQHGFNMVMAHKMCVTAIALSLNHNSPRTKALVLELLAAMCLVKGGHEITLKAFDNFKEVCYETKRFEKLMDSFCTEESNIDFMVACMQFINIVVHSVDDMNYRVHLQYEFTQLGLDTYLEKLRNTESDKLGVQIQAYLDNKFDVASLLDDSETKTAALERVVELEEQVSHLSEKLQDLEEESLVKSLELERQLAEAMREAELLKDTCAKADTEVTTLRRLVKQKDEEVIKHQTMLDSKLQELQLQRREEADGASSPGEHDDKRAAPILSIPPPPAEPYLTDAGNKVPRPGSLATAGGAPSSSAGDLPPPPPPPPPPVPPPPPPLPGAAMAALKIKKKHVPKFRLPVLNWVALKPNQVKGTVFSEIDDDKVIEELDMTDFEDNFKTKAQPLDSKEDSIAKKISEKSIRKRDQVTLIDGNRARNLAISKRKIALDNDQIFRAIVMFDLNVLNVDQVDILIKFVPTDQEVKAFREYEVRDRKPVEKLSDEDKFMLQFSKIERIQQRLSIMNFLGNFEDNIHMLTPQLNAVTAASMSIKASQKLKKMLEIILAFGNYMNSSKRGAAYGFKLQSLDTLLDTRSTDRKQTLLHYIAPLPPQLLCWTPALPTGSRRCCTTSPPSHPSSSAGHPLYRQEADAAALLRPPPTPAPLLDTRSTDRKQTLLHYIAPPPTPAPLLDTRSTDRKQTLLHYIARIVAMKYQDIATFHNELRFIEKASQVSLENVLYDVRELLKGMELVKREFSFNENPVLRDFLETSQDKLDKLQDDAKTAQEAYTTAVEYYGESPRTLSPNQFFSLFVRFTKAYKDAEVENEKRLRHQQAEDETKAVKKQKQSRQEQMKQSQDALLAELKQKKFKDQKTEAYHGAIEDIITDLKNEPYRRSDALRRSYRRKQEENLKVTISSEMEV
ncbi:FMNL3 [Branchiostoma lanceolatum]|uniref:FMNL3 protein n=1 Tax=Branchiostoma lanceolatum TaxID=7740 RepID=A0A8J9W1W8_BRALA|nr:FMNL3 [Branchiostoma lanceolatum]